MSARPVIDPATFHRPGPEDVAVLVGILSHTMTGWRKRRALRRMARKLGVHESDLLIALTDFLLEIQSELVDQSGPAGS